MGEMNKRFYIVHLALTIRYAPTYKPIFNSFAPHSQFGGIQWHRANVCRYYSPEEIFILKLLAIYDTPMAGWLAACTFVHIQPN